MPTPEYHARWSPSAAHRLLNCPASLKLGEQFPKTTSQYAEAGRIAHAIAELKARKAFLGLSTRTYNSQLKKLQASEHYDKDMDGYTQIYVEILESQAMQFKSAPFLALETSVPIGAYTGEHKEDGSFATGTADCIQIGDGILWVTDYKNGAGVPVSAEDNPQLKLYALGALQLYAPIYGDSIRECRMTIIQPALNSVSSWQISSADLREWGTGVVAPKAIQALYDDDPGKPNPGDWCRFCPAKSVCRERTCSMLAVKNFQDDPLTLSDDDIGKALTAGADLVSWYNDLKEYALTACLDGRTITGFKAVEGRSSREWACTAFEALQTRGIDEAMLYERKPVTVAGLEKTLGKKSFAEISTELVITKPGKPTLVAETDKRPAITSASMAFQKC